MARLEIHTTREGTAAVVSPAGELDLSGAAVLQAELDRLLAEPQPATIVLDLRGIDFLDSSGLRLVVMTDQRARAAGRRFSLVAGPDAVHRVFEITRTAERLDFVADPREAG